MRLIPLLVSVSALLVGCSEYDFHPNLSEPEPGLTNDTRLITDTEAPPPGEDCPVANPVGFDGPINEDCVNEVEYGTFTPVVEWYKPTWSGDGGNNQVMSSPIVTSVNDDNGDGVVDDNDIPDIAVVTYSESNYTVSGTIRVVSGLNGDEIWSVNGALQGTGGVAAADIDGDGLVEFISLTTTAAKAFEHDGTLKWTSGNLSGHIYGTSDVCSITDLEGDGKVDIICGNAIINADGSIKGMGSHGYGGVAGNNVGSTGFGADIDGDGIQEVISGNAIYTPDGATIWYNGQQDGYPAVADFDGDGKAEIIVSGQGNLRLQDATGAVKWSISIPGANSSYYGGPPTIADFDGDGEPEIGVAAGSRYSVIEGDGSILWQNTTDDSSSGNTGSAVFDFEGDGVAEVVYADQQTLWVFNGVDGSVKLSSGEHGNGTWLEYPVIADVDGDGHAEIVVSNTSHYGNDSGIRVFGDLDNSWMPGRKVWNQHAYSITHVAEDGTVPSPVSSNWPKYNNFRSGDTTAAVGSNAPDLGIADGGLCEIDCDEDIVVFWVHVGNEGLAAIEVAATLAIETQSSGVRTAVDAIDVKPTFESGIYQDSLRVELSAKTLIGVESVVFTVSSSMPECDENNNEVVIEGPFCAE